MEIPFIDLACQQKKIQKGIKKSIKRILKHGRYIMGPEVSALEKELSDFVGVKHCISVSSGTDALLVALMAIGIQPGDEVITTSFTFVATAEVIIRMGATPVFVDINRDTYLIDPNKIEENITTKTKVIIAVSLYGQCPDIDTLQKISKKHKLVLIEDAAQSFGAVYKNKRSCSMTNISCTSFFPAKPLGGYGDGGACFTQDDSLAEIMRQTINHGESEKYHYIRRGINSRLDTIQAAILQEKLKIFPDEIAKRQEVAQRYNKLLGQYIKIPKVEEHNQSVYAHYTIEIDSNGSNTNRRENLRKKLFEKGIPTAIYYPIPLHIQSVFKKGGNKQNKALKNTEDASKCVLSLPMHPYLNKKDQNYIMNNLIEFLF